MNQIDIFGTIHRIQDPEDQEIKATVKHSERFLKKSIAFHEMEISRLQAENYDLLINGGVHPGPSGRKHSPAYDKKKILLNEKEIQRRLSKVQRYKAELELLTK